MSADQLWQENQSAGCGAAEHQAMFGRQRTYGNRDSENRRPPANETVICTERIQIERKSFQFTLKENPRGRFLRITEDVGGRRDSIIVPATGLDEFCRVLGEVARNAGDTPPPLPPPENPVEG